VNVKNTGFNLNGYPALGNLPKPRTSGEATLFDTVGALVGAAAVLSVAYLLLYTSNNQVGLKR
jgi:hypothetical protein